MATRLEMMRLEADQRAIPREWKKALDLLEAICCAHYGLPAHDHRHNNREYSRRIGNAFRRYRRYFEAELG